MRRRRIEIGHRDQWLGEGETGRSCRSGRGRGRYHDIRSDLYGVDMHAEVECEQKG
jgi:hypothetical protein